MPYTPTRFFNGSLSGANLTDTALYTVPTGQTAIVTNLSVVAANGDHASDVYLGGDTDSMSASGGWGSCLRQQLSLTNGEARYHQGFYVVGAGGRIQVYTRLNSTAGFYNVSGLVGSGKFQGGDLWKRSLTITTTGETLLYSVPTGRTLILKTFTITEIAGTTGQSAAARIGGVPVTPWLSGSASSLNPFQTRQFDGSWIVAAGESLTVNIGVAGRANFTMSGVLL